MQQVSRTETRYIIVQPNRELWQVVETIERKENETLTSVALENVDELPEHIQAFILY